MKADRVIAALGALAQETRLAIYRLLVQRGPAGMPAGAVAEKLEVPPSSLSFHLHHLMHAGLITQERQSRQLIYAANFDTMNGLLAYLTENCCGQGVSTCESACLIGSKGAPASRSKPGPTKPNAPASSLD